MVNFTPGCFARNGVVNVAVIASAVRIAAILIWPIEAACFIASTSADCHVRASPTIAACTSSSNTPLAFRVKPLETTIHTIDQLGRPGDSSPGRFSLIQPTRSTRSSSELGGAAEVLCSPQGHAGIQACRS